MVEEDFSQGLGRIFKQKRCRTPEVLLLERELALKGVIGGVGGCKPKYVECQLGCKREDTRHK
jgi:hypothetical protein